MDFTQYDMINRYERIRALPESELDRRWNVMRDMMRAHGLKVLLIASPGDSGTSMWLLGTGNKIPDCIIFPLEDLPTAVYGGKPLRDGSFNPYAMPARNRIEPGIYGKVRNVNGFDPATVARYLDDRAELGIVAPGSMSVSMEKKLFSAIPGLKLTDVSQEFSRIRSVKSQYDIELCRASAQMHRIFLEAVPGVVRIGRTEREVMNDLRKIVMDLGSGGEDLCLMINITDLDHNSYSGRYAVRSPEHRFQKGDMFRILLETSGPGGQFCANERYWSFGEPGKDFMKRYRTAIHAHELVQEKLRPGNSIRSAADAVNAYINSEGYDTDNCCFIHSMGYTMGEYPMLSDNSVHPFSKVPDEDEPIQPNTIMIAHPHVGFDRSIKTSRFQMVRIVETYLILPGETERLDISPRDEVYRIE